MKRITTLMGATAITIAAGGCAVVPAYDVYGPPVAGGFGPGPVVLGSPPVVVQPTTVLIRPAPALVRPGGLVVRTAPGPDGPRRQGSRAYGAGPSSGPGWDTAHTRSSSGPGRGGAYAQSPSGSGRSGAQAQSSRGADSRSDPGASGTRAVARGAITRKDGVRSVSTNASGVVRVNPDSGKDSGW